MKRLSGSPLRSPLHATPRLRAAVVCATLLAGLGCGDATRPKAADQAIVPIDSIATPNVLDNASFETGWDGFTDWAGQPIPDGVTRDNTVAFDGSWSIKRDWVPSDEEGEAKLVSHSPSSDRAWIRFYFKLTAPINSIMKFCRWYTADFNTNLGGLFLGDGDEIFTFGTDRENEAITTPIGLTEAQVIDGKWHSLEFEYWRNGDPSGFPSAAFWFDGKQIGMPDGTPVHYQGAGNVSYWKGLRLYSGERSTSSAQLGLAEWVATLNAGNSTTGQVNIDKVSISTVGRIGP